MPRISARKARENFEESFRTETAMIAAAHGLPQRSDVGCSAWVDELQRRITEAKDCERAMRGKESYVKAAEFRGQWMAFEYALQLIRSSSTDKAEAQCPGEKGNNATKPN